MPMIESAESMKEKVQAQVPEPLVAVGWVQPAGTWGSFGLGRISPLIGMFKQRSANQGAGVLSNKGAFFRPGKSPNSQTVIALTADKLYAFEAKYGWGGLKMKGQLAAWDRKTLKVHLEPGRMSTKIIFEHPDGSQEEVEATTAASRGANDDLLNELSKNAS